MDEDNKGEEQEEPQPLTDEKFRKFRKKQKRESRIFVDILDFILSFFH